MISEEDKNSNAQHWELEVVCKNKEYLDEVVMAILSHGCIEFGIEVVDFAYYHDGTFRGKYAVTMWCSWFNRLAQIAKQLKKIEKKFEDG